MKAPLSRRTFLRASGVSLALPLLESMMPLRARAATAPPKRMVFICTTLGLHPPALWPETSGANYESTEYLDLLQAHRKNFTLFSGLSHESQTGRQPHNCEMTWLTAAQGPGLDGFRNSVSVDQYAAGKLGQITRFPSITLGSNTPQSQSYTSSGVMVPAETSPANLFAQMFLQGDPREVGQQKRKLSEGASILDQLLSQNKALRRTTTAADNAQLDEYFESIRQAEKDLAEAQAWMDRPKPQVAEAPPADLADPSELVGRTQLLMNLIPLILQTDSSRIVSVMIQDHRVVPKVPGVTGEHHNLSHHGQEPEKIAQLKRIEKELITSFGSLLTSLEGKREHGGTLLDHSSILFGSNLGNANAHDPKNLPIMLTGGDWQHGSYIKPPAGKDIPLSNLFLTLLQHAGIETDAFAASSATLDW